MLRIDDTRDVMTYMHDVETAAGLPVDSDLRDVMQLVTAVTIHCTLNTETGEARLVRASLEFD